MCRFAAFTNAFAAIPSLLSRVGRICQRRTTASASNTPSAVPVTDASSALSHIVSIANVAVKQTKPDESLQMTDSQVEDVKNALGFIDAAALGVEKHQFDLEDGNTTFVEVGASKSVTLAVFTLAEGASLPLHNHPGMFVFTKVLWGELGVRSYDLMDDQDRPNYQATRNPDFTVSSGDSIVLTPKLKNVHEFSAVHGPVALFDIVCPPYNENRPCSYLRPASDDVAVGESVELESIPTPEDLDMFVMDYCGVRFKL